jgi:hypothetical protein
VAFGAAAICCRPLLERQDDSAQFESSIEAERGSDQPRTVASMGRPTTEPVIAVPV